MGNSYFGESHCVKWRKLVEQIFYLTESLHSTSVTWNKLWREVSLKSNYIRTQQERKSFKYHSIFLKTSTFYLFFKAKLTDSVFKTSGWPCLKYDIMKIILTSYNCYFGHNRISRRCRSSEQFYFKLLQNFSAVAKLNNVQ